MGPKTVKMHVAVKDHSSMHSNDNGGKVVVGGEHLQQNFHSGGTTPAKGKGMKSFLEFQPETSPLMR